MWAPDTALLSWQAPEELCKAASLEPDLVVCCFVVRNGKLGFVAGTVGRHVLWAASETVVSHTIGKLSLVWLALGLEGCNEDIMPL